MNDALVVARLHAAIIAAGEDPVRQQEVLGRGGFDDLALLAVLRRDVPVACLEQVATSFPWRDRPRLLGAVAVHAQVPMRLAERLIPRLLWSDLATLAASSRTASGLRSRAERALRERLPDLRLGDRRTLARRATPPVATELFRDPDPIVAALALDNRRLAEEDVLASLARVDVGAALLRLVARSRRWGQQLSVRRALIVHPETPIDVAVEQLSHVATTDLVELASSPSFRGALRDAARAEVTSRPRGGRGQGTGVDQ